MQCRAAIKGNALFLALILGMVVGIGGGCGTGADPFKNAAPEATATFYVSPFALDDIVLPSNNGQNGGTVTITGTATVIQYILYVPQQSGPGSGSDTIILELDGEFTIPAASLAAGNVDGTTGTVNSVSLSTDFGPIFSISGLSVDAGQMTAAWTAENVDGFWGLVAGGDIDIMASSQSSPTNLYCTQSGEGTPSDNFIVIPTTTTVSIQQFLQSC
jgi:hypothetical protein